jgi:high-affinity Fe2+/Pb2+ permease
MPIMTITKREMSQRWKRTLFHFGFAISVIFGVIVYLAVNSFNGGEGPSISTLALIAVGFGIFGVILFLSGRVVKDIIWRNYGED